jgi:hypothetical protein
MLLLSHVPYGGTCGVDLEESAVGDGGTQRRIRKVQCYGCRRYRLTCASGAFGHRVASALLNKPPETSLARPDAPRLIDISRLTDSDALSGACLPGIAMPRIVALILARLDSLPPSCPGRRSKIPAVALRAILKFDDGSTWDGKSDESYIINYSRPRCNTTRK